jgi:PAS domain S-box-containing protein
VKVKLIKILFLIFSILIITKGIGFSQTQLLLLETDSFAINKALENARINKQAGNLMEESRFYNDVAQIYWDHFYLNEAISYFEKSLELNKKLGNLSGMSMINSDLGLIYADLQQYDKALSYFNKNLDYRKLTKDKSGMVSPLINISIILNNQKKYNESIKNLEEALSIARETNNIEQMKSCYGMLSETYEKSKQSDQAFYYFNLYRSFHEKASIEKEQANKKLVEETKLKLKLTETEKKNQDLELVLADKELKEKEKQLSEADAAKRLLYSNLSKSEMQNKLLSQDNTIKEINYQKEKALNERQKSRIIFMYIVTFLALSVLFLAIFGYINKRRSSIALNLQNKKILFQKDEIEKLSIVASQTDNSVMITDSLGNIEWINNGFTKMYGYILEDLKSHRINIHNFEIIKSSEFAIIKTLQSGETQIYETQFKDKSGKKLWVQTTLTPINDDEGNVVKLIFIDTNIQKIKESEKKITKQKEQIEKQKKALTDSINYAQYIQEAILHGNNTVNNLFSDSFILYKPKDVVSGDFYWFAQIKNYTIIVSSDCTGHGVPGAFLSLIGVNILNQIVKAQKKFMPDEIINQLHVGFQHSLNQNDNENVDGMDIAICTIDNKNNKLFFSGANRPIIYVQDDKINIIRGDLSSVGGMMYDREKSVRNFTLHEIDIKVPTSFYLFSDGYADQFGGAQNKKFNSANFQSLIKKNHNKPFSEQKEIFENAFEDWKQDVNQIDDILVIGIKI